LRLGKDAAEKRDYTSKYGLVNSPVTLTFTGMARPTGTPCF
jgi:hypothetical protein